MAGIGVQWDESNHIISCQSALMIILNPDIIIIDEGKGMMIWTH